jgi:chromosome segregation ATPase
MSEAQSSIFENNEFDNLKVFFQVLKENILPDEISKDQKWWEQDAKSKKFKIGLIRTKELDTQINIFGELYDMSKKKMKNTKTNINTSKTSKNNYFNSEENVEITEMNYETEIIKTLSEFDEEYLGWMNNQKIEEEEKKVRKNAMRQLFRFIFGSKKIVDVNEFHKKLAKAYIKLDPIHKIPCGDDPSKKLHDDFKQSLLKRRDKAVKDGQNILAVYGEKHILSDKMKTLLMGLRDMIDELDNPNSSCIVYGRDKGLEDEYERNQKLKIDLTKDENYIRLLSVFRDFVKDRKEAKLYTQTTLRSKFRNSTIKPDKDADELFNELIDFLDSLTDEEEVDELYEIILYLSFLLQVAVKLHEIQIVLDEIKCRLKGGEEEDEDDTGDLKAQVEDLKKKVSESKNILTENDGDSDEIKELKKTLKTFVDVIESGDNDKIKEVLEELSKLPELKRIQSELEGVKKALGEKEAALGKKEAELKNLNEKLNNITTTNESVDTLKQTLEQIKKDNQIEIDKLKQQIGQGLTEEKKDELEKKIKELTDDNTKLDSSIDAIKTELQQANEAKDTAVADLSGAIAAAKLAKEERNQGIAAAQKERNDAFVDLSGAKAAAEEAKKQKNSVEAEVARLTAELATKTATEEEKNRIEGELINAKNQLQQKTTELENAEKALTTAQQERNTAFEDLSGARQEVQKVTQERNTAIASADAAKAAAEQRVRDATEAKEQAEREKAAAIDLATASQQEIQRLTTELQQKGNIESEKTALTNQLNEEKNKLADANLAIDAANKRATEADSKMALAQAAATAAQEAAADAQAEAAKQVDAEKQAASAAIKAAEEGAKKAIKEANDAANIAIQAAKEQVEKMKEDISDLTTQLDEAEEIRKEAVKELVKEIEKAQEYKAATVIQTSALRQMIDIKKDRIKELEEQIRKLQEASAGSGSGSGPGPGPEDGDGGSVAGSENDDGNSEDGDGDSVIKQENIVLNTPDEHTIVKGLYHDFIKIVTPLLGENSKYLYYNTGKKYPYSTNNISHIYNYMKNENKINDDVTLLNDYKELILKKFKELLENTNAVIYKKIKQNLFNIIKGVEITNNYK